jgi:plastocyanin
MVVAALILYVFSAQPVRASEEHHHGHSEHKGEPQLTKHNEESLFVMTGKKLFGIEMLVKGNELRKGVNEIQLIVHDNKDRDVLGAKIVVTPWMPDMGHGVLQAPVVSEEGGGVYVVDNIHISMAGNWQLKINVKKGGFEDNAVFDFPGMKAGTREGYIKAMSPAGYEVVIGRENPLPELEPEVITENGKKIKVFRLAVKDAALEIHPGKFFEGWGFNGTIPGPTIRVREGDRIRVILTNETDAKHTLHVHGQKKPVIMDGVPYLGQKPVEKGGSYTYEFTVEIPGTSFYHCHVDSAHHVDMGMYGAFIVEPRKEKVRYDREYIMILDEFPTGHVHVHPGGEMEGHEEHGVVTEHPGEPVHEHEGEEPGKRDWYPETYNPYEPVYDAFTINGKAFPHTEPIDVREGERVRIRFINAGYEPHFMHTHSHKFIVTHRDGLPVKEQVKLDTVEVGPGQRVDIILFADNPGVWPFHCHRLNHVANDGIYPGGMMTLIRYVE